MDLIRRQGIEHLRLLFALKWKLQWRMYRRDAWALVGALVLAVCLLPVSLGVAGGCAAGFLLLEPPGNRHLLLGVLIGIYLLWLVWPLLGGALSDAYDVTKLFIFPIAPQRIFAGAVLGSLVDIPTLLLLPTLAAVLIGFTKSVIAFGVIAAVLALFLLHTLSLSQTVMLAGAGILRSRRARDIAVVLMSVAGMLIYVVSQTAVRVAARMDWRSFLRAEAWGWLNVLPPVWAARSIAAAGRGQWVESLLWLLALAGITGVTVWLSGWLLARIFNGAAVSPSVRALRPVASVAPREAGKVRTRFGAWLPPAVAAMVGKEFKYMRRDPYYKVQFTSLLYMLAVGVFVFFTPARGAMRGGLWPGLAWAGSGFVLMQEMAVCFNMFGPDAAAAGTLFSFPASRRQLLVGKALALFVALSVVNLIAAVIMCALIGRPQWIAPVACWMLLAVVIFLAAGSLISILFPFPVVARGWKMVQRSASRGAGFGMVYLGAMMGCVLVLLPVLAALLVPSIWISPAWLGLTMPLACAYTTVIYWAALQYAEPLLLRREMELVEKLKPEE